MDALTKRYRIAELSSLDRMAGEYKPCIQIHDGNGGKTKHISITDEEMNKLATILCGKVNWNKVN